MAQKFITKRNRHLFRKPIKAKIEEKVMVGFTVVEEPFIELPSIEESVEVSTVESNVNEVEIIEATVEIEDVTPQVVNDVVETEIVEVVEEPKKRKNKRNKETTEEITVDTVLEE